MSRGALEPMARGMRLLPVLLLLIAPVAADPAPSAARAFRGFVEAHAVARGREEQTERVDLLVVLEPPRERLLQREAQGRYELRIDQDEEGVRTRGHAEGGLRVRVGGWINARAGRYALRLKLAPDRVVVKTTLSGIDRGRFQTLRTVALRGFLLASFDEKGALADGGRTIAGSRTFTDRKTGAPREVKLTWRLERIDPILRGRVVDHLGRPLAGLRVIARTTNPARRGRRLPPLLRETRTDARGRYSIDAFFAHWNLEVVGVVFGDRVVEGREDGVALLLEKAPPLDFTLPVYRLAALPRPKLLRRYFRGDVKRYLAYVRERVSEDRLRRARLAPPAER